MYLRNCLNSSNIKHCSQVENYSKLENMRLEIGNFSYATRLPCIRNNRPEYNNLTQQINLLDLLL